MKEEDLEQEFLNEAQKQKLQKVTENLYLTKYQADVLERFHVPYREVKDTRELLYYLSDIVDEEEYDELEEVAREISDYYYYHEMKK